MSNTMSDQPETSNTLDLARLPWSGLPAGMQLILNADLVGKEFRRRARQRLTDHDVNDRRASIISFLSQVGPQSINDLAQKLEQHKAAISSLLIRMESDGLIEFTPNPEDKRSKSAGLTEKGKLLAEPIRDALLDIRHGMLEGVGEADVDHANAILLRMLSNLNRLAEN